MFTLKAKSWLTTYFINFYFIWGIFLPFWGIWLVGEGVTTEQVGLLFSVGLILRFMSSFTVLPLVSTGSATLKLIRILSFILCISFSALFYLNDYFWLASITLFINFMMAPMMPLGDIIGSRLVQQIKLDYGKVRLWGSLAFIAGSTMVGWLISEFDLQVILYLIVLVSVLMCFFTLAKLTPKLVDVEEKDRKKTSLWLLFKKPEVFLFLLIVGSIQGSHGAYYAFSTIYWDSVGLAGKDIAWLWGIAVFAEVLVLRFNQQLFSRWSIKQMILLGLIGGIIRWSVFSFTTDFYGLMAIQTFHGLTFAVTHLAAMRYISRQKSSHLVAYQSLYSGVALGLMMAIFTYIGGITYEQLQGNLFLLSAALLLPVFVLLKIWKVKE
ncbi:major facilitator superfamily transporter [Psychromonas sp. CNPT3]|uniref:3-phenylpropionate MFS transporter n=1 Tax=Psychromonas sp. CNPT3 TaxID=314282 RepID=UPI00006E7119|nr:3-phenylpropionate MFS transporter [Psychromonas sp. CNPT3]AGH81935.1 major facilitator superfamily transporter [Psychromonas sp. CNPT3]